MIRLAVLDMAGTTVDCTFAVHDAMISSFEGVGLEIDRKIANACISVPAPLGIRSTLKEQFSNEDESTAEQIHEYFLKFVNHFYKKSSQLRPMPGAESLFEDLRRRGIKVYLSSGFSRQTVDLIINRFKWLKHGMIDGTVASDEVQNGRPFPDMIQKAMQLEGITEGSLVMKVGDTPNDILEGKNAGCGINLAFYSGAYTPQELKASEPDDIIHTLSEVSRLLSEKEQLH